MKLKLLGEGCTENIKASSALHVSHRFSPGDLILLLPIFTCLRTLKADLRLSCAFWKKQGCSGPKKTKHSLLGGIAEDIMSAPRRSSGPPKQGIARCTSHVYACVSPCCGCCAIGTAELKSAGLLKTWRLQSLTESLLFSSLQPTSLC